MVNEKAQLSKDQGNTAFKAGNYPVAIGHYTAAMLADKNDPTIPSNRAAAYLKLGKYEDAERDCTTVLSLSKDNVKALFRRGQARIAIWKLLEAQADLSSVLLIEPSNTSAQEEMKKVTTLIQQEKAKKSKASFVQPTLDPAAVPAARRRVPIKIVDPSGVVLPTKAVEASSNTTETNLSNFKIDTLDSVSVLPTQKANGTLEAVSSRSLKSPGDAPPANTSSASKPANFLDAKVARDSVKAGRVGGGIFRASGENTIFGQKQSTATENPLAASFAVSPNTTGIPEITYTNPSTLFDFTRTWNSFTSAEERWRHLNTVQPDHIPALCKTSLEPSLLISILETFLAVLATGKDAEVKKQMLEYLEIFSKVQRFETVVLLLSKAEKEVAKRVWYLLGVDHPTGFWKWVA